MVPLGSVINVSRSFGPDVVQRYNAYTAADINGGPAPGYSSGQAQAVMAKILDQTLPRGMSYEWTDLAYQQLVSGNTGLLVFPLCVLFVFLVLAAQYESLSLPLPIILTSMAFIMGVVPLTLATGAGAEVRHALGITVFAGMIGVTAFGLLLTPVFYVFVRRASRHAEADSARHTGADSPGHLPAPE